MDDEIQINVLKAIVAPLDRITYAEKSQVEKFAGTAAGCILVNDWRKSGLSAERAVGRILARWDMATAFLSDSQFASVHYLFVNSPVNERVAILRQLAL